MGRSDAAGGEDVGVAVAERVHRRDDLVLDIGDHPHLADIDADIGQVLGDVADVLVLGPPGKDFVADDENRRRDDGTRVGRRPRRCFMENDLCHSRPESLSQRKDRAPDWWWMAGNGHWDKRMRADLIARYADERLPRYTSYPTAPHFTAEVGPATYGGWLEALPADVAASLYLHVPFCRRMCWYCGCNTAVSLRDEPISAYMDALLAEIAMVRARLGREIDLAHVHFGGGTPTIVAPDDFARIMAAIDAAFRLRPEAEIAIEIDPRVLTAEMAAMLGRCGVNRASLGVQSLDPAVQAAINRRQSFDETALAVDRLRAAGIAGINIDLIYGLPLQTVASCLETVDACLTLRPDRFAVFGYAHVPAFKKHQRRIDAAPCPPARTATSRPRRLPGDWSRPATGRSASTTSRCPRMPWRSPPTKATSIATSRATPPTRPPP